MVMNPEIKLIVFSVSVAVIVVNFALLVNFLVSKNMIKQYRRIWKYCIVSLKQLTNEEKVGLVMVGSFCFVYGLVLFVYL